MVCKSEVELELRLGKFLSCEIIKIVKRAGGEAYYGGVFRKDKFYEHIDQYISTSSYDGNLITKLIEELKSWGYLKEDQSY